MGLATPADAGAISTLATAAPECSVTLADSVRRPSRSALFAAGSYLGDVTVDGRHPSWQTTSGASCDAATHAYTWTDTPSYTGALSFGVADTDRTDNARSIALTVSPGGT